jgi:uncharacterized membrane protein HdeD (DUF308 family)
MKKGVRMNQRKKDELYFKVWGVVYILVGIPCVALILASQLPLAAVMSGLFFLIGGVYYWVKGIAKGRGIETPKFP